MNLGNDHYFAHPFTSNSDLLKHLPPAAYTPDLRQAFARGTLLDALETAPMTADFLTLRIVGYDWQYTKADFDLARWQRDALRKDAFYQSVKSECVGQEEFYREDVEFCLDGFKFILDCRIKYDLWSRLLNWGIDLKTTSATSIEGFMKSIDSYHYDQQRAFYMRTADAKRDLLVGVSNVKPFRVFPVRIKEGDDLHRSGVAKMSKLAYIHLKSKIA